MFMISIRLVIRTFKDIYHGTISENNLKKYLTAKKQKHKQNS